MKSTPFAMLFSCWLLVSLCSAQFYWGGAQEEEKPDPNSKVVVLTDDTFHSEVIAKGEPMFVQFYAPWCGHCKRLMPTWDALASELLDETRFGRIDCVPNEKTKDKYMIRGYPTLKLFIHGRSHEFRGMRTPETLKAFLSEHKAFKSQQQKPEKHVLHSFAWRGDAEPVRLALAELAIPFEEVLYSEEEWADKREQLEASGLIPLGQLPALVIGESAVKAISSSQAILRHLALKHNMYGDNEEAKTMVDVLLDDSKSFYDSYSHLVYQSKAKFDKARGAWEASEAAEWLSYFNEQLKLSRETFATDEPATFFAGTVPTVADMAVFSCVQIALGLSPSCLLGQPELKEWFRKVGTRDNINDYLMTKFKGDMNSPRAAFGNKGQPEHAEVNPFRTHA